ncbi:glycosyltransferase [Maricaulis parjimensis]|uniref:glycosyltransferase n=1 Tax=Maricaulis parjimensis TaxID=144023 RepID=UPI001939DE17|nr:glycosyltransferase [Maricaulis parjimensis]
MQSTVQSVLRFLKRQKLHSLRDDVPTLVGRPAVVGLFRSASGIGSGARLLYRAMRESGFNPSAVDLTDLLAPNSARVDWAFENDHAADDSSGPLIFHLNAPELPFALSALGGPALRDRLRIAYWAWELEQLPTEWRPWMQFVHEIWTPSTFTAMSVQSAGAKVPVRPVGYALDAFDQCVEAESRLVKKLAPSGQSIILHAFDARSSMDRKNPLAAIRVFKTACEGRNDAILLLKVSGLEWRNETRRLLENAIGGDPRIHMATETLSDWHMKCLIANCDVYLSPHRSEGYGLMLAKFLLAGSSVVATNWSGNTDFSDLPGHHGIEFELVPVEDRSGIYRSRGNRWAEPDCEDAARLLRQVLDDKPNDRSHEIAAAAAVRFDTANWAQKLGEPFYAHQSAQLKEIAG